VQTVSFCKILDSTSPLELNSSSSLNNSRWTFDYEHGLTLNHPNISDTAFYYVVGYLPFVNGKQVNIKHDEETTKMLKLHYPSLDQLNATDVVTFPLTVKDNETVAIPTEVESNERVIEEGSTLTLTCIEELDGSVDEIKWIIPRITQNKEVIKQLHFSFRNFMTQGQFCHHYLEPVFSINCSWR
jgi:hypothetical protein